MEKDIRVLGQEYHVAVNIAIWLALNLELNVGSTVMLDIMKQAFQFLIWLDRVS